MDQTRGSDHLATRALAIISSCVAFSGCCSSEYPKLVGRYAADEVTAAGELAPLATIPYRLCRQRALLAFVVKAQQSEHEPPPWPRWYGEEIGYDTPVPAYARLTWRQTCDEWAKAGQVIHTVARGLRAHGHALAALAAGPNERLDTTAIETANDLVIKQVAGLDITSGAGKVASQTGSAFAAASQRLLDAYRTKKLEQVFIKGKPCMDTTFDELLHLHDALVMALTDAEHRRSFVVRVMVDTPLTARADRGLALAEAMDAVGETDHSLKITHDTLDGYRIALEKMKGAYASLAKLAADERKDADSRKEAASALGELESSLQNLNDVEH